MPRKQTGICQELPTLKLFHVHTHFQGEQTIEVCNQIAQNGMSNTIRNLSSDLYLTMQCVTFSHLTAYIIITYKINLGHLFSCPREVNTVQFIQLNGQTAPGFFPCFGKYLFPVFVSFHLFLQRQPTILSFSLRLSWSAAPKCFHNAFTRKALKSSSSCGRMPSLIHSYCAFREGSCTRHEQFCVNRF